MFLNETWGYVFISIAIISLSFAIAAFMYSVHAFRKGGNTTLTALDADHVVASTDALVAWCAKVWPERLAEIKEIASRGMKNSEYKKWSRELEQHALESVKRCSGVIGHAGLRIVM